MRRRSRSLKHTIDKPAKLDEIEANAVEIFTIEEMRILILKYTKKIKHFIVIIADPTIIIVYNFYYACYKN